MYYEFEIKSRAFNKAIFGKTIYVFKVWKVRSPMLQTICESELKRGSYVHLKQIVHRRMLSLKLII